MFKEALVTLSCCLVRKSFSYWTVSLATACISVLVTSRRISVIHCFRRLMISSCFSSSFNSILWLVEVGEEPRCLLPVLCDESSLDEAGVLPFLAPTACEADEGNLLSARCMCLSWSRFVCCCRDASSSDCSSSSSSPNTLSIVSFGSVFAGLSTSFFCFSCLIFSRPSRSHKGSCLPFCDLSIRSPVAELLPELFQGSLPDPEEFLS